VELAGEGEEWAKKKRCNTREKGENRASSDDFLQCATSGIRKIWTEIFRTERGRENEDAVP